MDVVFPENISSEIVQKISVNFPEIFQRKRKYFSLLNILEKSYEPQYHMSIHLCTTLVLYVRRQTFQTHLMSAD